MQAEQADVVAGIADDGDLGAGGRCLQPAEEARGADAAGFRTALYAGLDVVGPLYATKTEFGTKFRDIVASEGVPAAVRWRAAQFRE